MPRACHHSAVLFFNISVPQSDKLMLLTNRLTLLLLELIGLLKSKSIGPSINRFFCLKDPQVGLSPHPDGRKPSQFYVSFILGFALRDSFRF